MWQILHQITTTWSMQLRAAHWCWCWCWCWCSTPRCPLAIFIFESLVFVPSVLSYMCYSTTRVFSSIQPGGSCQQDSGRWISMTGWQCSGGADSNDEPLHYQAHTFCFQEWHPFLAVSIVSTNSFNAVFIIKIPPTCIYHVNHLEDVDNFCQLFWVAVLVHHCWLLTVLWVAAVQWAHNAQIWN